MSGALERILEKSGRSEQLYAGRVSRLIRRRYSADDEFAILRQKDVKPEEFAAYNDFAELCKREAKGDAQ